MVQVLAVARKASADDPCLTVVVRSRRSMRCVTCLVDRMEALDPVLAAHCTDLGRVEGSVAVDHHNPNTVDSSQPVDRSSGTCLAAVSSHWLELGHLNHR